MQKTPSREKGCRCARVLKDADCLGCLAGRDSSLQNCATSCLVRNSRLVRCIKLSKLTAQLRGELRGKQRSFPKLSLFGFAPAF